MWGGCLVSRFWLGVAVLLGGAMLFMTGVGVAAEYGAFKWPSAWPQTDGNYRNGYVAGVMDTVTYIRYVGLSGNASNAAFACQGTKGLTDVQVVKTVEAMLASNPKFDDNMAAATIVALQGCKLAPPPTGNVLNRSNTIQKR